MCDVVDVVVVHAEVVDGLHGISQCILVDLIANPEPFHVLEDEVWVLPVQHRSSEEPVVDGVHTPGCRGCFVTRIFWPGRDQIEHDAEPVVVLPIRITHPGDGTVVSEHEMVGNDIGGARIGDPWCMST